MKDASGRRGPWRKRAAQDLILATPPTFASMETHAGERRARGARDDAKRTASAKAGSLGLSPEELDRVGESLLLSRFRAGETILSPGDAPDFVSAVGSGAVKLVLPWPGRDTEGARRVGGRRRARALTVQYAKPSFVFGLLPSPGPRVRSRFGAIAHVDSWVAAISRDRLAEVLERAPPEKRILVVAYLCRVLSKLIAGKCRLLSLDVPGALLQELWQLARDFPTPGDRSRCRLRLRQEDLADLIGASRLAVQRGLEDLRRRGLVACEAGFYRVTLAALPDEADGRRPSAPTAGLRSGGALSPDARSRLERGLRWGRERLGLPRAVIQQVIEGADLRSYSEGQTIATDEAFSSAVLISGSARVLVDVGGGREVGVWIARPGHFIGSGWVRGHSPDTRAFRVVAHERAEIAVLSEEVMVRAVRAMPTTAELLRFFGYMTQALSRQLYDKCIMLPMSVLERTYYQLCSLANDFPAPHPEGTAIALPLDDPGVLAPFVAARPSTFRRVFQRLVVSGRVRRLPDGRLMLPSYRAACSAA